MQGKRKTGTEQRNYLHYSVHTIMKITVILKRKHFLKELYHVA